MAVVVAGLLKLRFETEVLSVLPSNLEGIEAMRIIGKNFGEEQQVILALEHEDGVYEEDAAELAAYLDIKIPGGSTEYRSQIEEDPSYFARTLADLWINGEEEHVALLSERLLDKEKLKERLAAVKKEIELTVDAGKATQLAYDPLGFSDHEVVKDLGDGDFSYESEDGTIWLLFLRKEGVGAGHKSHADWVTQIDEAMASWEGLKDGFQWNITGGPVNSAEIGTGMESDMRGTVLITTVLVGILFFLVQRSFGQLLALGVIMVFVFVFSLSMAGWFFGTLNMISIGFAAILVGLVIDYGIVMARESMGENLHGKELRKVIAPGILWAAATTALVFAILTLSTFNGVKRLGLLVIFGLLSGSVVTLYVMPIALRMFPSKKKQGKSRPLFMSGKTGLLVLGASFSLVLGIFAWKGLPKLNFEVSVMEPKDGRAALAYRRIQEKFPAWSAKNLQILASAETPSELIDIAAEVDSTLIRWKKEGLVLKSDWPKGVVPNAAAQKKNKELWMQVYHKRDDILGTLEAEGFSEKGIELTQQVLERFPGGKTDRDEKTRMFYQEIDNRHYLVGGVTLEDEVTEENAPLLELGDGAVTTGWSIMRILLLPWVQHDFEKLFVPASGLLILALWGVFRSWRDALIPGLVLLVSLGLVNVVVVLSGWQWNFLNGMALPLVVGTGIDYGIHLIFALRRSEGDLVKVWNGVGKAIFFCGLSSAIGFGSLALASNEALASMGLFCCVGVLLTMTLSVLVIPGLWMWLGGGRHLAKKQMSDLKKNEAELATSLVDQD